ncbi:hypothetical protein FA09DRAFT_220136 [Tilletiopsis washingtonensis]|uniref:Uncharacterized protein n=1 Tax=Tilletiopsis washingtonensis TaxID=58919 RepID=A0A316ZFW7_9BASI|nr:hypothetical protein FA09DRAFT_220136 [Tilletiopsis washingtonensis]PWN99812.1 hypothetical protein FA09DRAFT_220136 [Tilletiopsis washingtonensis]
MKTLRTASASHWDVKERESSKDGLTISARGSLLSTRIRIPCRARPLRLASGTAICPLLPIPFLRRRRSRRAAFSPPRTARSTSTRCGRCGRRRRRLQLSAARPAAYSELRRRWRVLPNNYPRAGGSAVVLSMPWLRCCTAALLPSVLVLRCAAARERAADAGSLGVPRHAGVGGARSSARIA